MSRHAYLIIAHTDSKMLGNLVESIDDARNDIFIHVDRKTEINLFSAVKAHNANLKFIDNRVNVYWGDSSQIDSEYALLRNVSGGGYSRIHLLSGADFPLKSQDYIHNFFDLHPDEEFIDIEGDETNNSNIRLELYKKCHIYHFFLLYIRNQNRLIAWSANFMRRVLMALQMTIGIKRKFSLGKLSKGSNWVSITQRFADRLIELEGIVKKEFRYTHCCDEVYKQTIALNERFTIFHLGNLRYVDFKRGSRQSPYTFVESDFEELKNAPALFARKFSSTISGNLVARLKQN